MNKISLRMKYKALKKKLSKFKEVKYNEYHWKVVDLDGNEYVLVSNMTVHDKERATEDRITDGGLLLLDDDSHIPLTFVKKIWVFEHNWAFVHSIKGGFYADYKRLKYYMSLDELKEFEQEYKDVVQALENVEKALGIIKPKEYDINCGGEPTPCGSYKDGMCEDKNTSCDLCMSECLEEN